MELIRNHLSILMSTLCILDVCLVALNRCLQRSETIPPDDPNYEILLEYEFLDDAGYDWALDAVRFDSAEGRGRGELLTRKEVEDQLKKKSNHTLSVMVCSHVIFVNKNVRYLGSLAAALSNFFIMFTS